MGRVWHLPVRPIRDIASPEPVTVRVPPRLVAGTAVDPSKAFGRALRKARLARARRELTKAEWLEDYAEGRPHEHHREARERAFREMRLAVAFLATTPVRRRGDVRQKSRRSARFGSGSRDVGRLAARLHRSRRAPRWNLLTWVCTATSARPRSCSAKRSLPRSPALD